MPADEFEAYFRSIEPIRAGETLEGLMVSSFPHMEKSARKKYSKKYERMARPDLDIEEQKKTTEDLAKHISRMMAGG